MDSYFRAMEKACERTQENRQTKERTSPGDYWPPAYLGNLRRIATAGKPHSTAGNIQTVRNLPACCMDHSVKSPQAIIQPRLRRFLRTLQSELRTSLRLYLRTSSGRRSLRIRGIEASPFWLQLPLWVASHGGNQKGNRLNAYFLANVTWAQFCVFLSIKIQDDLFDGHTNNQKLMYPATILLLEAQRSLLTHFSDGSPFWPFYSLSLRQTYSAILETDRTQLKGPVSDVRIAQIYSKGYSACKISLFAVCLKARRLALFPQLSALMDELAVIGQLMDDFEDIEKDLKRGRLNYAAHYLLGRPKRTSAERSVLLNRIERNMLLKGTAEGFFEMLRRHLHNASHICKRLKIREITNCVFSFEKTIDATASSLHHQRVALLTAK